MAKKKTSKKLARIAGKYLNLSDTEFYYLFMKKSYRVILKDVQSLAASVLSQYETEQKKK